MKYWTRWLIMTALYAVNNVAEGQFVMRPDDKKSGVPRSWITSSRKDGKPDLPPPKPPTLRSFVDSIPPLPPVETPRELPLWMETPRADFSIVPPLEPVVTEVKRNWWIPLLIGAATVGTIALLDNDDSPPPTVPPGVPPVAVVPEPSVFWLLLTGLVLLTFHIRRTKLKT